MTVLKSINLGLAFLIELLMLAAFAYWGFNASTETIVRVLLGVGVPLIAVVIWGIFLAPRSARRIQGIGLHVAELVIFGLAALALVAAGRPVWAAVFAVVALINQVLLVVWKQ